MVHTLLRNGEAPLEVQEILDIWQQASVPALNRAGHALKEFSGLDFAVKESYVKAVHLDEISARFTPGVRPIYAVHLRAVGLFQADVILIFSDVNSQRLVSTLMGEPVELPLDPMGVSALGEVGNVVGTAFLNVFSDLLQNAWEPTTPRVIYQSAHDLIQDISPSNTIILSEALFQVTNEEVTAEIMVVPTLPG